MTCIEKFLLHPKKGYQMDMKSFCPTAIESYKFLRSCILTQKRTFAFTELLVAQGPRTMWRYVSFLNSRRSVVTGMLTYIPVFIERDPDNPAQSHFNYLITELFVEPRLRHRGIGCTLLDMFLRDIREQNRHTLNKVRSLLMTLPEEDPSNPQGKDFLLRQDFKVFDVFEGVRGTEILFFLDSEPQIVFQTHLP